MARPSWQERFLRNSNRISFKLQLSHSMIDYLCAVAEDVTWDRRFYDVDRQFKPDNWIATEQALEDRGLIHEKPKLQLHRKAEAKREAKCQRQGLRFLMDQSGYNAAIGGDMRNKYELTPVGRAVVDMLRIGGMFVEQKLGKAEIKKKG